MLKRVLATLCAAVASMSALAQRNPPEQTLHVRITGFKSSEGTLAIALFGSEEEYERLDDAVREAFLPIRDGASLWTVENLPAGDYAVAAYHDANGNGELDTLPLGMPREAVGFSNEARPVFGPPGFEAVKFAVREPVTRLTIELR